MPLAHHNGQSIFFAHVPKTGGSSVEDYLIQRFGPLSLIDVNKRTGVTGTGLIVPATHLAAIDIKELVPHDLAYSFAVVRDPLRRLESEFRYQSGVSQMSKLGFSPWLKVMLKAASAEPRLYENHIRPQSDLVPEGAEIFKLEDGFDTMIARLDAVTGHATPQLTVPHINTRKKEPITMSRADVAALVDFYAADYDRFGYPRPDPADYPDTAPGWRDRLAGPLAAALVRKQRRDWVK
jgi:hypothetical protein